MNLLKLYLVVTRHPNSLNNFTYDKAMTFEFGRHYSLTENEFFFSCEVDPRLTEIYVVHPVGMIDKDVFLARTSIGWAKDLAERQVEAKNMSEYNRGLPYSFKYTCLSIIRGNAGEISYTTSKYFIPPLNV